MKEGDNQRDQDKGLDSPSPCPLGFLPLTPSFLTHTHTPSGCWLNSNNHLNIVYPVQTGTLTLHVRRLVHISQVSGVFLKGQYQCSCTDILTKILTPCRYGKCFQRCWQYISLYCFNNRFFDRLKWSRVVPLLL